ncbi:hypothetical protein [Rhizorhabdus sp.]|jgi:hypothetical protein|uniref:hypothetical protein n=1 Tax=Rhizorhabdus sp. TaxID=1968843 RepID=UPI001B639AF9|nr:hypothetical protein [Rhizorhabdus sp.]MBP8233703.1 hypothetical protein [Rhizorhabdus sp.]
MLRVTIMAAVTFWLVGSIAVWASSHMAATASSAIKKSAREKMADSSYRVARQLGR